MDQINNSLTDVVTSVRTQQNQMAQPDTMSLNLRRYMVTNDQSLLSSCFCEMGLVQTLIKQPIDDAYRDNALQFHTEQLEPEEIQDLLNKLNEKGLPEYLQARKWGRLFGGAGLIINTEQDPSTPFDINQIKKGSKVDFYAANRWELNYQPDHVANPIKAEELASDTPYNYYGQKIHKSRVLRIMGEEAPPLLRLQLMGWGMSELERLITVLSSYIKYQDVIFELLDEAKVDVFKINGFNAALARQGGTDKIVQGITVSNKLKSYLNSIVMDKEDDYEQKTLSFAGVADLYKQLQQGVASAFRMPVSKIFGIGASGFSSGEDDLENYNCMIESEIRGKDKENLIVLAQIVSMQETGMIPDDLHSSFKPLRILNSEQEQAVKNAEYDRLIQAFEQGLITDEEFKEACNKNNLLPIKVGG